DLTLTTTLWGTQWVVGFLRSFLITNGDTSTCQGMLEISPDSLPGASWSRSGNAVRISRAASNRSRRPSMERVPRTLLPIDRPIDDKVIAKVERATRTSMRVKPLFGPLTAVEPPNFDPPRQPVDANLITDT